MDQPQPLDLVTELKAIRQFRKEIDDNLAKSEEILALANSKLGAANALLKQAAVERDKILIKQAEVLKIARSLREREAKIDQKELIQNLNTPYGATKVDNLPL